MIGIGFINKKQVCKELQISVDTFDVWVGQGLPEYRIGSRITLVKQQELTAWIEAHGTAAVNGEVAALLEDMQ